MSHIQKIIPGQTRSSPVRKMLKFLSSGIDAKLDEDKKRRISNILIILFLLTFFPP